ncbi:MAG: Rhodoferax phage, partial [Verrucomicrobiota bacterium]
MRLRHTRYFSTLVTAILCLAAQLSFAQGTVAPVARQTWFTNNGEPAAGYWVCVYQAGTDTLATTYTTAALSVANANPLVLDSAGRGTVFLSPGRSYKFVLKSPTTPVNCTTGTTIWSVDQVSSVPAGNVTVDVDGTAGEDLAAGNVAYLSDGSGSKNAGQWYKADADFTYASTTPQVGLVVSAISSGATGSIRIQGRSTGLSSLTPGSTYYVSATAGALTTTSPTNSRYVGQADSATSFITTPNPPPVYPLIDARIKTIDNGRCSL